MGGSHIRIEPKNYGFRAKIRWVCPGVESDRNWFNIKSARDLCMLSPWAVVALTLSWIKF